MESYVVRIYRSARNNPAGFVGIVEKVGEKGKKAFTEYDELWEILNPAEGTGTADAAGKSKRREGK